MYAYLELSGDYNLWVKRAIKRANLIENVDFVVNYLPVENPKGGRPATEHHLSFDAAKLIAMMSSATKGHEVRLYFLECEKVAQDPTNIPRVKNPAHQMLIDTIVRLDAVEQRALAAEQHASEAQAEAHRASENAQRAMASQLFLTVAEYIYINTLQPQVPKTAYKACSDHLRLYCMDKGIPFRKIPVGGKHWEEEYAFHSSVYTDALPGWLKRRFAQSSLHILSKEEDA